MTLQIEQSYHYNGDDYWDWSAWISGSKQELAQVKSVTWHLHPSFSPSIIPCTDRETGFRLDTSGWGTFVLRADVLDAAGKTRTLRHTLELYYPDDTQADKKNPTRSRAGSRRGAKKPQIFITFDSADRVKALQIRKRIEAMGIVVVDPSASITDDAVANTAHLVEQSDGMIAVVGTAYPSPLFTEDVKAGVSLGKPMLVMKNSKLAKINGLPKDVGKNVVSWSDYDEGFSQLSDWVSKL